MSNAIEIRGLNWHSGKRFEIRDLNLTVPSGAIYGFLGPNGAGKTSTIRLLMGMAQPAEGTIGVLGMRVPGCLPHTLARTGYVPERPHLYPGLTVEEAIRLHSAFFPSWDPVWVSNLGKTFRLDPAARIRRLSKGETGKLLILLALAQRPDLLVLDEPTDGLDPVVRRDVLSAVLEYVSETGATVFISSHLIHELERFCDWVGVLENGRILAETRMEAFRNEIKKVRVVGLPSTHHEPTPFRLLRREAADSGGGGETWLVQGWEGGMVEFFTNAGATVREVIHLDLEETFVELLGAARAPSGVLKPGMRWSEPTLAGVQGPMDPAPRKED